MKRVLLPAVALMALSGTPGAAQPAAPAAPAAPSTPAIPAIPAFPSGEIDAQLAQAERQLAEAAHEVARLSTQMSGAVIAQFMPATADRVVIGVQLEAGPNNSGARVHAVSPGGPAAEAGIRPGDLLLSLNGVELKGAAPAQQVSAILRGVRPEQPCTVRLQRDGRPLTLELIARRGPVEADADPDFRFQFEMPDLPRLTQRPLRDMELASLTPQLGTYFGTDHGVLVVRAPAQGALKLQDGDVILSIDGREPKSGSHATRILGSYQGGEKITLRIMRQHRTLELETALPQADMAREARRHAERTRSRALTVASGEST